MAKEQAGNWGDFFRDLFTLGVYKRSQGRIARQATFGALVVTIALGVWSLDNALSDTLPLSGKYAICGAVLIVGTWLAYRAVNIPRFADFLIAVEAEMNKVSWPSRHELVRATIVVLVLLFGLMVVLFLYDLFWQYLLSAMGVLRHK